MMSRLIGKLAIKLILRSAAVRYITTSITTYFTFCTRRYHKEVKHLLVFLLTDINIIIQ